MYQTYTSGNFCAQFISTFFASTCNLQENQFESDVSLEVREVRERIHKSGKKFNHGTYIQFPLFTRGPCAKKL